MFYYTHSEDNLVDLTLKVETNVLDIDKEWDNNYQNLDIYLLAFNEYKVSDTTPKFKYMGKDEDGKYIYLVENTFNLKQKIYLAENNIDNYYNRVSINGEHIDYLYDNYYKSGYIDINGDTKIDITSNYQKFANLNLNVDVDGIKDSKVLDAIYSNTKIYVRNGSDEQSYSLVDENGNINKELYLKEILIPDYNCTVDVYSLNIENYGYMVEYKINDESYYSSMYGYNYFETPGPTEDLNISATIHYMENATHSTKNVKWTNKDTGEATIELGYTSRVPFAPVPISIVVNRGFSIYKDVLSDDFELSNEYINNSKWTIFDTVNESGKHGIPDEVYYEFFSRDDNAYTEKEFVYVKDTKTIYWCESDIKAVKGSTTVNVIYNKYENVTDDIILDSNKEATLVYGYDDLIYDVEKYNIISPKLKFKHTTEKIIKINKIVDGEIGNKTYYVGLFENNTDTNTDKIYKIDAVDGKGNTIIEISNFDENKNYYIYEVNENGDKIISDEIKYNNNKVEFDSYVRDAEITTDEKVVSSLRSESYHSDWKEDESGNYYFETDKNNSLGTGEYVDNYLTVKDIYQEDIVISSTRKLKVTYIPEDGGTIEGDPEEIVEQGKTPQNVPTPKPDDGYKFVRWEVEENGKRIEVNPSEYVIEKDTIFYAIFEPIPVKLPADTSDINVGGYVVVLAVAIIGIASVVFFGIKSKKKSKSIK